MGHRMGSDERRRLHLEGVREMTEGGRIKIEEEERYADISLINRRQSQRESNDISANVKLK